MYIYVHVENIEVLDSGSFSPNLQPLWVVLCPTPNYLYLLTRVCFLGLPSVLYTKPYCLGARTFLLSSHLKGKVFHVSISLLIYLPLTKWGTFYDHQKLWLPFNPQASSGTISHCCRYNPWATPLFINELFLIWIIISGKVLVCWVILFKFGFRSHDPLHYKPVMGNKDSPYVTVQRCC